jgi:hypothetical protein
LYLKVCDSLNENDRNEFLIDLRKIDVGAEGRNYIYGLAKYYMREDIPAIDSGLRQIVQMNQLNFNHDLRFGHQTYSELKYRDLKDLYSYILDPSKYEQFLSD